jgi:hypothetical protein
MEVVEAEIDEGAPSFAEFEPLSVPISHPAPNATRLCLVTLVAVGWLLSDELYD